MRKIYNITYIILVLLMIITLIIYSSANNDSVKSFSENIFGGLLTGLIIAFLSNLKIKLINGSFTKIKQYSSIIDESNLLIKKQIETQTFDKIEVLSLINLYVDCFNNIKNYCELNGENIREAVVRKGVKIEDIFEKVNKRTTELSEKMKFTTISLKEYKNNYQTELADLVTTIHILQMELKKDLEVVFEENNKLNNSIL